MLHLPRSASLFLSALAILPLASSAFAAEKVKVGVIGLDNYQAVAFTYLFQRAAAGEDLADMQVVAAYPGGSPDIEESVQGLPRWVERFEKMDIELVDSIDDLLAKVDAVLLMSLDGRVHLAQVTPVLEAQKPVYVGRPLAASLVDAVKIFQLAEQHQTPLFSCSQHRFVPGFIGMREHPDVGRVLGCSVYGGLQHEPSHPDFYWHSVHSAETLFTIMGSGCRTVTRTSTPDFELVAGVWDDGRIGTFRGIGKGDVKYSGIVFGDKGILRAGNYGYGLPEKTVDKQGEHWLAPKGEYMGYKGVAVQIARFFKTGKPPVSPAQTLEIFAFIEAANESKRRGGVPVRLDEVLSAARETAGGE